MSTNYVCGWVIGLVSLATACSGGGTWAAGADRFGEEHEASSTPGPGPTCTPANPKACGDAQHQETPPPPPVVKTVGCTIEVTLKSESVTSGQGLTEGDFETSVVASSDGTNLRWPATGDMPMAVGNTKTINEVIRSYQLKPKQKKTINLCATVTEDDDGVVNGSSDVGNACQTFEISCNLASTGAADVVIPTPLCQGNKLDSNGNCKHFNGATSTTFHVGVSDEDWDGVPNEQDATPKPEDEACRGQLGRAVLLFLDFGDSDLNNLVGAIGVGVDELVQDYDFVAIATDPAKIAGFTLNASTLAAANMIVPPTEDGVMNAIRTETADGYDITGFFAAHGGADTSGLAFITSEDTSGFIFESELDADLSPAASGTCAFPFRAMNSLACYFSQMNDLWLRHGGKVSGGATFTNFFPQELNGFGRNWNAGDTFGVATANQTDPTVRALNSAAVEAVGLVYGCSDVLGSGSCAQDFFTTSGPTSMSFSNNGRSDYDATLSGSDNMAAGSKPVVAGAPAIDKFTPMTW